MRMPWIESKTIALDLLDEGAIEPIACQVTHEPKVIAQVEPAEYERLDQREKETGGKWLHRTN